MVPHEKALVKRLADRPFAIVGVNSDADRREAVRLNEELGITWRSFWNGPESTAGPISRRWCVTKWPTLYLLDHEGVIRHVDPHGDTSSLEERMKRLSATIEQLVEDAESDPSRDSG